VLAQRFQECIGLLSSRIQLKLDCSIHGSYTIKSILYKKGGVKSAFLCRLKPTVSCAQIL
jgi:hypothetical protein